VASVIFNNQVYLARWRGKLHAPAEGDYAFSFAGGAQGVVIIDGKTVYGAGPGGAPAGSSVHLTAGLHDIEARYASQGGSSRIELMWTAPGAQPAIIPPINLTPLQRSWTPQELPNAPAATLPPPTLPGSSAIQPDLTFGSGDLSSPRGIAVDKNGNIYVGDRGNHRIVAYSPDGKLARTWGQTAPQAQNGQTSTFKAGDFGDILDVGVGQDGLVYAFDSNGRLQAFSGQGDFVGSYDPSELPLYAPNGIGVGADIYVAVTGQSRIVHLPSMAAFKSGQKKLADSLESITGGSNPTDQLDQPVDVAVDPGGAGLVYVADLKDRILQLSPPKATGQLWTISAQWSVQVGTSDGGSRLAVSPDGAKVYMTDPDRHRVDVLDVTSGQLSFFGSEGTGPGQFEAPLGIAVGPEGRVFVVDSVNRRVQVFSAGTIK
jgi:DNA-binding beta-propeller fold protein YncE